MGWMVEYCGVSNIGKYRRTNQDNMVLLNCYMDMKNNEAVGPVQGEVRAGGSAVFAVFDGMGGEERGEMASFIAADRMARRKEWTGKEWAGDGRDLTPFCLEANKNICLYAEANQIHSMGTTAAILKFGTKQIWLCNVGDSRIYRFANGTLQQISHDHVDIGFYGRKPPLSQNLGIPEEEFIIEPFEATGSYEDGDRYLICSDGLTDMVTEEEIAQTLADDPTDGAVDTLLRLALEHGGRDNITMILCRVKRTSFWTL